MDHNEAIKKRVKSTCRNLKDFQDISLSEKKANCRIICIALSHL